MIKVGDKLPNTTFRTIEDGKTAARTTDEIFKGKRVVLVGMPGAFTPTCHRNHLPGFIQNADTIRAKKVDAIAVTAANDHWVMHSWGQHMGADGKLIFLADNNAEFAKAIGLDFDASAGLGGTRSKRYSMLVEDGIVKILNIETETGKADVSGAENLIKSL
ncbi:MAG TPA: peroxiredoxin [Candidatus Limnocylindria bacterium]|nr:peroxiredoxin [Candidatus Limnocylindria bacterium]